MSCLHPAPTMVLTITSSIDRSTQWFVTFTPFSLTGAPGHELDEPITVIRCTIKTHSSTGHTVHHADLRLMLDVDTTVIDFSFLQHPDVLDYLGDRTIYHAN